LIFQTAPTPKTIGTDFDFDFDFDLDTKSKSKSNIPPLMEYFF